MRDRFRPIFCNSDFYTQHLDQFLVWKNLFQNLTIKEKTIAWTLSLGLIRRPNSWFGGVRKEPFLADTTTCKHPLSLSDILIESVITPNVKVSLNTNLTDFTNCYKIKAFPESCHRALTFIQNESYLVHYFESEPTAFELLNIQASRGRVISFSENIEQWPETLYNGRDFLSFILHDLVHADCFFSDPISSNRQQGFYIFVSRLLDHPNMLQLLSLGDFRQQIEYIIADMNAHPVHLLQTLHSLLSRCINNQSEAVWSSWVQHANTPHDLIEALTHINLKSFTSRHAQSIENYFEQLSTSRS